MCISEGVGVGHVTVWINRMGLFGDVRPSLAACVGIGGQ